MHHSKEFKWNKKIEPLIYGESKRDFIENMEQISLNTCRYYFSLLNAQTQLRIAEKNLSNQDTLFQIAQGRFRMGKIAENDLLQMELALLNSKNNFSLLGAHPAALDCPGDELLRKDRLILACDTTVSMHSTMRNMIFTG